MDELDQVALFNIAIMLDLDNLLSFCSSSSKVNRLICQQDAIWLFKLAREFPDWRQHFDMKPRNAYKLLIDLTKLKIEIKYQGTIYKLYKEKELDVGYNKIKELPSEIGILSQLQKLSLNNNKIESLPSEIGNLTQLRELYLSYNMIKELPSEIGNLKQLRKLSLNNNQLKTLLSEISNLAQLEELYLYKNQLKELPSEISHLSRLRELWLDKNIIISPELKHLPIKFW